MPTPGELLEAAVGTIYEQGKIAGRDEVILSTRATLVPLATDLVRLALYEADDHRNGSVDRCRAYGRMARGIVAAFEPWGGTIGATSALRNAVTDPHGVDVDELRRAHGLLEEACAAL